MEWVKSCRPLYTSELERAIRSDQTHQEFLGVFASDQLPHRIGHYPASLVVNTDPVHKPGTHWIAYYFDAKHHLDYFDSEGMPPHPNTPLSQFADRNADSLSYCDKPLQSIHSAVCGYYCIAFLSLRNRGYSLEQIVSFYWGGKPGVYDERVCREVSTNFRVGGPIHTHQLGGSGSGSGNQAGQCCCSIKEWCHRIKYGS